MQHLVQIGMFFRTASISNVTFQSNSNTDVVIENDISMDDLRKDTRGSHSQKYVLMDARFPDTYLINSCHKLEHLKIYNNGQ